MGEQLAQTFGNALDTSVLEDFTAHFNGNYIILIKGSVQRI